MEDIPIFEPRAIFRYQKRYLYLEIVLSLLIFSMLSISWIPSLFTQIAYGVVIPSAIRAALFLTSTAILVLILSNFFIKQIRRVEIITTDERLIIKSPYRLQMIFFAEIESVKFIRFPVHHGLLKIKSPQSVITIPLYIEKMEELVQDIATGLVRYGSIDIFDKKTVADLNIAAVIYQKAYERGQNVLIPILTASVVIFVFNMIIGVNYWGVDMVQLAFWAGSGIMIPPIIYFCTDTVVNKSIKNSMINQGVPLPPQSAFLLVTLIVALLYFVAGWVYKAFTI